MVAYCGSVIYVQTPAEGGNDNNSGWRWDVPKATVTAALQTAVQYGQSQVWVAKGTYYERITLPAGVFLYGGFVGDETSTSGRPAFPRPESDPYETVLDGQNGGDVVTATSTNVYNTLNGFTLRNGTRGVNASSVLTVFNCRIHSNSTGIRMTTNSLISRNHIFDNAGDGVYVNSDSGSEISRNIIEGNSGRGVNCDGGSGYAINRNRIEYNTSTSYGGGVRFWQVGDTPMLANNFIRGNQATYGGGVCCFETTPHIYNNTIVDNSCSVNGDGIWIRNLNGQTFYICNNIVAYNTGGYGIYVDNGGLNYQYTVYLNRNYSYQNDIGNYGNLDPYNRVTFNSITNDRQADPGLSSDRLHLASGSACIGDGNQYYNGGARYYGSYDIDGQTRIVGSFIDVGCDEVQ